MDRVAVLGSTGMLGSALTRVLEKNSTRVYEFNRLGISVTKKNESRKLDIGKKYNLTEIMGGIKLDYIINCIGIIRKLIDSKSSDSLKLTYEANANFPKILNDYANSFSVPLIQIGTDCVYSGKTGSYVEGNVHDPSDFYGFTKSQGELNSKNSMIIRCSVIGKELNTSNSLLSWVLSQPKNANLNGFTNYLWNGVTSFHFSQVVSSVISNGKYKEGVYHLIPRDVVTKYELINHIAKAFKREDLKINKFEMETKIDRTLSTSYSENNLLMWQNSGYNSIPSIGEMVKTYAEWA